VTATVLVAVVIVPLVFMLAMSLRTGSPANPGDWTLANYQEVYGGAALYQTLGNTIVYALVTALISLSIAGGFAWLVERTDLPFRNVVWIVMLLPIAIPGMLSSMAWLLMLTERVGIVNLALRWLLGLAGMEMETGPLNIYSLGGMIFVESMRGVPTLFLMLVASFRLMDPSLEEAAGMAGARTFASIRRITAPLLLPVLLATAMYGFIGNLDDFETPLLIGAPAGIFLLSTVIYFQTSDAVNWGIAAVYSTIFLIITVVLVAIYHRVVLRHVERFATLSSRAFKPRRVSLGRWRWPCFAGVMVFFFLSSGLPLLVLVWASLLPAYEVPSMEALSKVSFDNYVEVATDPRVIDSIWNSFVLGIGTGVATMLLAFFVGWAVVRIKVRGRFFLDALAFIPHALPTVTIVVATIAFHLSPAMSWAPLYGTMALMIIALTTRYIAFGTRTSNGAMAQLDASLEEAAAASGASKGTVLRKITAPLLLPAFLGGFIFVATHGFRNLTIPLMMAGHRNQTIASFMYTEWRHQADVSLVAAIGVFLVIGLTIATVLTRRMIVRGYTGQE